MKDKEYEVGDFEIWMSRHESINKVWEERKIIPRNFGSFTNPKEYWEGCIWG